MSIEMKSREVLAAWARRFKQLMHNVDSSRRKLSGTARKGHLS
jgi:hypothetical protein